MDVILTWPSPIHIIHSAPATSNISPGLGWAGWAAPLFELLLNARLASAATAVVAMAVVAVPLGCAEVQESESEYVNTEHRKPSRGLTAGPVAGPGWVQGPSSLTWCHTAAWGPTGHSDAGALA